MRPRRPALPRPVRPPVGQSLRRPPRPPPRRPLRQPLRPVLVAAALLLPAGAVAQEETPPGAERPAASRAPGTVIGRVVDDETGAPVRDVVLQLDGPARSETLSGREGAFRLRDVAPGVYELRVSHIAYGRATWMVNVPPGGTVELDVRLVPRAIALDSIVVRAEIQDPFLERGGYYQRKRRAVRGTFMEGDDLPPVSRVSTMLSQAPFVELRTGRSAFERVITIRHGGRECVPDVFIDGRPVPLAEGRIDELVLPGDVRAIEFYYGLNTPPEFILHPRMRPCGAIVIWRKRV